MAITLQEAIDNSEININELAAENEKQKEFLLGEIVMKLDKLISVNILTILQKPINRILPIDGFYNCDNEIIEMYKDFSITFSSWSRSVSIKLADKDWDWKGYGIKDNDIKKRSKQKGIFGFLISK